MNLGDVKLVIDKLNTVEAVHYYEKETIDRAVTMLETLGNKVTEQAAVIENLRDVLLEGHSTLHKLPDRESCKCSQCSFVRNKSKALAYAKAGDSKQILTDWMREQIGKPAGYYCEEADTFTTDEAHVDSMKHYVLFESLFKLPECLR